MEHNISASTTLPPLPQHIVERIAQLPPVLTISQLAELLKMQIPTVRQQIRRGTFPISIRQIDGGSQFVLLADVVQFLRDGVRQPQFPLQHRAPRNPGGRFGRDGKPVAASEPIRRGRKSNRQKAAERAAQGGA